MHNQDSSSFDGAQSAKRTLCKTRILLRLLRVRPSTAVVKPKSQVSSAGLVDQGAGCREGRLQTEAPPPVAVP